MRDIHETDQQLGAFISNLKEGKGKNTLISKRNRKFILDFIEYSRSKGLKNTTILKDGYGLQYIARVMKKKSFDKAKKKDYVKVLATMQADKELSDITKRVRRVSLKKFVKWIKGIEKKGVYPEEVEWVETTRKASKELLPDDLITQEEFGKMVSAADNQRDKCFLYLLFETGCRIGEALNIQLKQIVFRKDGLALLMLNGKTGMRRIPVYACVRPIKRWLEVHPQRDDREAYLFVTKFNRVAGVDSKGHAKYVPINYRGGSKLLKKLATKAGINKRIYPHLFRHTASTDKVKWLPPRLHMDYSGWNSSQMIRRYSHLSVEDLVNSVKEHYEIDEKKERDDKVENLMIEFMQAVAKSNPKLKKKLKELVEKRGMEGLFR